MMEWVADEKVGKDVQATAEQIKEGRRDVWLGGAVGWWGKERKSEGNWWIIGD